MNIYEVPKDYDFLYWSTPADEMNKIGEISDRRSFEWSLSLSEEERKKMPEMAEVIPSQFFAALSLQVTKALHLLITEHDFDFDRLSGIFIQRVNEIESGTDVLFIVGVATSQLKYIVTPYDIGERMHSTIGAKLIGTYKMSQEETQFVH